MTPQHVSHVPGALPHDATTCVTCPPGLSPSEVPIIPEATRSNKKQQEATRSNKKQQETTRSNKKHQEATRSTKKQQEATRSNKKQQEAPRSSKKQQEAARSNKKQQEATRSNKKHADAWGTGGGLGEPGQVTRGNRGVWGPLPGL